MPEKPAPYRRTTYSVPRSLSDPKRPVPPGPAALLRSDPDKLGTGYLPRQPVIMQAGPSVPSPKQDAATLADLQRNMLAELNDAAACAAAGGSPRDRELRALIAGEVAVKFAEVAGPVLRDLLARVHGLELRLGGKR